MEPREFYNNIKNIRFAIIAVSLILAGLSPVSGQIVLTDSPVGLKPAEFYIAAVKDEREVKGPFARMILPVDARLTKKTADLQGGLATAISRYLSKNMPGNRSSRAVSLGIRGLELRETVLANGNIDGNIKLKVSFGLQKDYGVAPLVTTQYAMHYIRPPGNASQIEVYLRNLLKSSLSYFNDWMNSNVRTDFRLAKKVKFTFSDYSEKVEGDTIYYSAQRRLIWDDFQSRNIYSNKYQALVIPGIGYNQEANVSNGTIYVHISMKTYLPKSAAWARLTGRNAYMLNHEQRHFDIAKIIVEQFKRKVLAANLQPDTYEAFLNMQYLDSFRDMDAMQKAYDRETSHGLDPLSQDAWNTKIDKELSSHRGIQAEASPPDILKKPSV